MLIGNTEISPALVLAPMAGITGHPFRLICRRFGAGAVWTDMISSHGIRHRNHRTLSMFDWTEEERPVVVQIFGADPDTMAKAAVVVEASGADIIDINLGCPMPKVMKTGAGAGLMDDLQTAREIMHAVVRAVRIPVTVKTRKGMSEGLTTAPDLARMAEDEGIAAITIHGRTAAQAYAGHADWGAIAEVKRAVRIPVIGNGDVKSPEDAKRMFDTTGCDAVMIGRAALGNPWLFSQTAHFLETGELPPAPDCGQRVGVAREHLRTMAELLGEHRGLAEMRGQLGWYFKGVPGAARARQVFTQAASLNEVECALSDIALFQQTP